MLVAENLSRLGAAGYEFSVATVDHRLRPAAAQEAESVARLCSTLGLSHRTLSWLGPKPAGNLAAEARSARYRLLTEHAGGVEASAIMTAHHEDDQIETHFLAAARGAGDRGLAGMRPARIVAPGTMLLRPFLHVPGARLKAATAARGVVAADDPSNRDPRFDRARLRAGLHLDADARAACLVRIARHAGRRDAEDASLNDWAARLAEAGAFRCDPYGRVTVEAGPLRAGEGGLTERFLGIVIRAVAGAEHVPARVSIRSLAERMRRGGEIAATLGGASIRGNAIFTFMREYGRSGIESLDASKRCEVVFDRRFKLFDRNLKTFPTGSRIVACGSLGRGNAAERTLPLLMSQEGDILAVPRLLREKFPREAGELGMAEEISARLANDLPGFAKICTKS